MSEGPFEELERLGAEPVPAVDPLFADRLESDLRVRHAAGHRAPLVPWRRRAALGLAATGLIVAGLFGLSRLGPGDGGVPLEVTGPVADRDLASEPPAGDPSDATGDTSGGRIEAGERIDGGDEIDVGDQSDATPTPEPTPTVTTTPSPSGTSDTDRVPPGGQDADPTVGAGPEPTGLPASHPTTDPTPARAPALDATPMPTPPAPAATAPPPPTVRPQPTPSPGRPTPTPSDLRPTPTPTTPVPRPSPTVTVTPVPLDAACRTRIQGDAIGVVCEWRAPVGVDIARFTVHRTRNGGARELVATVRPPRMQIVDRNVRPGDSLVYVVTGLTGDAVRAVSERVVLQVPVG